MAGVILREADFTHECSPPGAKSTRLGSGTYVLSQEHEIGVVWMCPCGELFEVREATYNGSKFALWFKPKWRTRRLYATRSARQAKKWGQSDDSLRKKMLADENVYSGDQTPDFNALLETLQKMWPEAAVDPANVLDLNNDHTVVPIDVESGLVMAAPSKHAHPYYLVRNKSPLHAALVDAGRYRQVEELRTPSGDATWFECACGK